MLLNYTNPRYFDTSKWRIRLTLPLKLRRNQKQNGSATVKAAATEKYIKRKCQQEVKSEDLTASQFADIAGIKAKPDEENYSEDESDITSTNSSPPLTIWDTHFWQNNNDRQKHKITTSVSESCISTVLSEAPCVRQASESGSVQRGRFKIFWGMDAEQIKEVSVPHKINCVEWKRKKNT